MAGDAGELSFALHMHPRGFWLCAPVNLPGVRPLEMIVDTGLLVCSVSRPVRDELLGQGLLEETAESYGSSRIYGLGNISVEGQLLPDINIHVSNRATLLRIDGILGLEFLAKFKRVCFDVETLRLTLTP